MEIFKELCHGDEYINNEFFIKWHKAIINDLDRFINILNQYNDSIDKDNLLIAIDYIKNNILNKYEEDDYIILKSTPEYFLFSFFDNINDMPTFILLSKDYKKFLIASEEMECFDDKEFDENERYGIYNYNYFFLNDKTVNHYKNSKKEYTFDYTSNFYSYFYSLSVEETERYYKKLLKVENNK